MEADQQQVADVPTQVDIPAEIAAPTEVDIPTEATLPIVTEVPQEMDVPATAIAPVVIAEPAPVTDAAPVEVVIPMETGVPVVEAAVSAEEAKPVEQGIIAAVAELRKGRGRGRKAKVVRPAAVAAKAKAPVVPKKKPITGRFLDKVIKARRDSGIFYHSSLFKCSRADLINADGDIRHFDCETVAQIGPFAPGTKMEVIDWLGSANLLFMSRTGKIADTVVMPLSSGSLETQVPIEP